MRNMSSIIVTKTRNRNEHLCNTCQNDRKTCKPDEEFLEFGNVDNIIACRIYIPLEMPTCQSCVEYFGRCTWKRCKDECVSFWSRIKNTNLRSCIQSLHKASKTSKVICDHYRVCPARDDCKASKPHTKSTCFICDKYSGKPKCILFKEYILCAAIHYDDAQKHEHQPFNIKKGFVVCGLRHSNCFAIGQMISRIRYPQIQGFITNQGKFVNRHQAYKIAEKAEQLIETSSVQSLISEDLY